MEKHVVCKLLFLIIEKPNIVRQVTLSSPWACFHPLSPPIPLSVVYAK
jgi:hypothetical protein